MQSLASSLERIHINEEPLLEINVQSYTSGAISKLPPENLLRIFELLVKEFHGVTENWYHITHVCRFWRQLAINTSTLWTNIPTFSDEHNPNWTRVVLQRSKSIPLDIDLVFTNWKMNLVALQHISHIRRLNIEMQAEDLDDIAFILSSVGSDAQLLEIVSIWAGEDDDPQFKLSRTSFAGTNRLKDLDLRWVDVDWGTPLLQQNLSCLSLQDLSLESAPSWDELLTALENMPRLTELRLRQALPLTRARSNMAIVDLPQLQRLHVSCNTAFQARSFLSRVSFPPLEMLDIGCDANDRNKQSYSDTLRAIARRAPSKLFSAEAGCRFLTIILDWSKVIDNKAHLFSCRSDGHNFVTLTRATRAVDIKLASIPDVSTETIIAEVVSGLQLGATLTSVELGGGREALSSQALQEIFGSIPHLKDIHVSGKTAENLISALDVPINAPHAFPVLESIFFSNLNLKYDSQAFKKLVYNVLLRRREYGIRIKRLHLSKCLEVDIVTIECLAPFAAKVTWDQKKLSA